MSRHIKQLTNGHIVAYGYDHALGYFIDEYQRAQNSEEEDHFLLEESTKLTGMTDEQMVEYMQKYDLPQVDINRVLQNKTL